MDMANIVVSVAVLLAPVLGLAAGWLLPNQVRDGTLSTRWAIARFALVIVVCTIVGEAFLIAMGTAFPIYSGDSGLIVIFAPFLALLYSIPAMLLFAVRLVLARRAS